MSRRHFLRTKPLISFSLLVLKFTLEHKLYTHDAFIYFKVNLTAKPSKWYRIEFSLRDLGGYVWMVRIQTKVIAKTLTDILSRLPVLVGPWFLKNLINVKNMQLINLINVHVHLVKDQEQGKKTLDRTRRKERYMRGRHQMYVCMCGQHPPPHYLSMTSTVRGSIPLSPLCLLLIIIIPFALNCLVQWRLWYAKECLSLLDLILVLNDEQRSRYEKEKCIHRFMVFYIEVVCHLLVNLRVIWYLSHVLDLIYYVPNGINNSSWTCRNVTPH